EGEPDPARRHGLLRAGLGLAGLAPPLVRSVIGSCSRHGFVDPAYRGYTCRSAATISSRAAARAGSSPPAAPIASAIAMPRAAFAGPTAISNEIVTSENAPPFHASASRTPIAPPSSDTSALSSSSAAPTRHRPNPSARSVPISRIRRLIVAYIVFAPA